MSKRFNFSRYAMYNSIENWMEKDIRVGNILAIGETLDGKGTSSAILEMFDASNSKILCPDYPDVDMQNMPYNDNTFDYVVADQVLEHVRKPWIGVEEIRRVLKPGGIAIITTCLMQRIHGVPDDYFRFTPEGLKVLCENFSTIIKADGMGDFKHIQMCATGYRKKKIIPGTELEKDANRNDGKHFTHVWIIVEK